jgi:hypothetical protein
MERLTENYLGCNQIKACGNAKCEETCKEVENCGSCPIAKAIDKLAEYEQAEEDGLLIRLPCPIGTTVYYAQKCQAPSCRSCLKFSNCYCEFKARIFEQSFDYRHLHAFGHSVFLTKAEAEQALAKMKGE